MSGSTSPDTTTSPSPNAPSMTTRSCAPLLGSAVNATPAFSELIICWITTAMAGSAGEVTAGAVGDHARARTATSSSEAPRR